MILRAARRFQKGHLYWCLQFAFARDPGANLTGGRLDQLKWKVGVFSALVLAVRKIWAQYCPTTTKGKWPCSALLHPVAKPRSYPCGPHRIQFPCDFHKRDIKKKTATRAEAANFPVNELTVGRTSGRPPTS